MKCNIVFLLIYAKGKIQDLHNIYGKGEYNGNSQDYAIKSIQTQNTHTCTGPNIILGIALDTRY